jgi:CRP/FNR family cyclic AMP-dependent transcriptional regulator
MNTLISRAAVSTAPFPPLVGARLPSSLEVTRNLIEDQSIIGHLPERDQLDLLRQSQLRTLRAREIVYRHGDPGRTVFAVLDGYVKLSSTTAAGREAVLDIVRPGMSFGELAALNNWPRDTNATTLSRCRLLAIDGRQFTQVMERSPEGLRVMVDLLSDRLRAATQRVLDAVSLPASARLAKALFLLAEMQSPTIRNGIQIDLLLSQSELGGMTGLTRESINKHLAAFRDAGWISLSGGLVTLLDVAALDSLLGDHEEQRPVYATIS